MYFCECDQNAQIEKNAKKIVWKHLTNFVGVRTEFTKKRNPCEV
jgi:hypothetical protein